MPITRDNRAHYLRHFVPLAVCFARRSARPDEAWLDVLDRLTPLRQLTTLAGPAPEHDQQWVGLLNDLDHDARRHAGDEASIEQAALGRLWPVLEPAIERYVHRFPWTPSGYNPDPLPGQDCGLFCYEFPAEGPPDAVALHMGNVFAPCSPFEDLPARGRELLTVLRLAQQRDPARRRVGCSSWLNAFPPFQTLFPAAWHDAAAPARVSAGYNWWGQFTDRRGCFHTRHGEQYRRTGRFPYPSLRCSCGIAVLRRHLTRYLAQERSA